MFLAGLLEVATVAFLVIMMYTIAELTIGRLFDWADRHAIAGLEDQRLGAAVREQTERDSR